MTDELKPLSKKHQRFVDEYLQCFNATQAYLRVYPSSTTDAARANAARLIATDNVKAEVQARLTEAHMSADEALMLLADMARGDIGDFLDISSVGFSLDLEEAQKKGITKLIKKIEQKVITINGKQEDKEIITTKIELHDPQSAIEKILRVHEKLPPSDVNIRVTISDD